MIQNIEDPEIYASFLIKKENPQNYVNLKYRDFFGKDVSMFDLDNDSILAERLPIYCVPLPGVNKFKKKNIELEENIGQTIKFQELEIGINQEFQNYFEKLKEKGVFNSNSKDGFPVIVKVIFLII